MIISYEVSIREGLKFAASANETTEQVTISEYVRSMEGWIPSGGEIVVDTTEVREAIERAFSHFPKTSRESTEASGLTKIVNGVVVPVPLLESVFEELKILDQTTNESSSIPAPVYLSLERLMLRADKLNQLLNGETK